MAVAEVVAPLSDLDHRTQPRRAVIASTVGTTIEWYDFLLYGQMAAIVFAKLYFPSSDPLSDHLMPTTPSAADTALSSVRMVVCASGRQDEQSPFGRFGEWRKR